MRDTGANTCWNKERRNKIVFERICVVWKQKKKVEEGKNQAKSLVCASTCIVNETRKFFLSVDYPYGARKEKKRKMCWRIWLYAKNVDEFSISFLFVRFTTSNGPNRSLNDHWFLNDRTSTKTVSNFFRRRNTTTVPYISKITEYSTSRC